MPLLWLLMIWLSQDLFHNQSRAPVNQGPCIYLFIYLFIAGFNTLAAAVMELIMEVMMSCVSFFAAPCGWKRTSRLFFSMETVNKERGR